MRVHTLDITTLMENLAATILADDGYLRVMEIDGHLVGGMWGFLSSLPWSRVKLASDIILFVHKDYRGYGVSLVDDWVAWSIERGAKEVILSTASGIKPKSFGRLMQRKGFTLQGQTYSKEIL